MLGFGKGRMMGFGGGMEREKRLGFRERENEHHKSEAVFLPKKGGGASKTLVFSIWFRTTPFLWVFFPFRTTICSFSPEDFFFGICSEKHFSIFEHSL